MQDPKIYADAYQLAIMVFNRTRSYSKPLRPTLGRRLEEAAIDLLIAVRSATTTQKGVSRQAFLLQASEYLDGVRILLQLAHDMKALPAAGYAEMSEQTANVGRQVGGFLRATSRNQNQEKPGAKE